MKLNREILRLALPSILANVTVPLVGMVDIAVAGHLPAASSAALIGGISIGAMLFDLLYWNFGFLRAGTGGLTAQAYGRGEATGGILMRALRIAVMSGSAGGRSVCRRPPGFPACSACGSASSDAGRRGC